MNNTAIPINILVSATSWGEIDDDDVDDNWPLAEEVPARHAAAWRIYNDVIIVVAVTTVTTTAGMPAPYTKMSR